MLLLLALLAWWICAVAVIALFWLVRLPRWLTVVSIPGSDADPIAAKSIWSCTSNRACTEATQRTSERRAEGTGDQEHNAEQVSGSKPPPSSSPPLLLLLLLLHRKQRVQQQQQQQVQLHHGTGGSRRQVSSHLHLRKRPQTGRPLTDRRPRQEASVSGVESHGLALAPQQFQQFQLSPSSTREEPCIAWCSLPSSRRKVSSRRKQWANSATASLTQRMCSVLLPGRLVAHISTARMSRPAPKDGDGTDVDGGATLIQPQAQTTHQSRQHFASSITSFSTAIADLSAYERAVAHNLGQNIKKKEKALGQFARYTARTCLVKFRQTSHRCFFFLCIGSTRDLKLFELGRASVRMTNADPFLVVGSDNPEATQHFLSIIDADSMLTSSNDPVVCYTAVPEHMSDTKWLNANTVLAATGKGNLKLFAFNSVTRTIKHIGELRCTCLLQAQRCAYLLLTALLFYDG